MGWIRIRMDLELGKFRAGSGSGINHFGSTTLQIQYMVIISSNLNEDALPPPLFLSRYVIYLRQRQNIFTTNNRDVPVRMPRKWGFDTPANLESQSNDCR